jgi:hypothetical protein
VRVRSEAGGLFGLVSVEEELVLDDPSSAKSVQRETAYIGRDATSRATTDRVQPDQETIISEVDDFLGLESQILERLQPSVPGAMEALTAAKLSDQIRWNPAGRIGCVANYHLGILRRKSEVEVPPVHDLVRATHPVGDEPLSYSRPAG